MDGVQLSTAWRATCSVSSTVAASHPWLLGTEVSGPFCLIPINLNSYL